MAVNKSHEASSSSSSSRPWRYDVFLSFRGEDTRRNFTDHLFNYLQNAGINNVFRDDNELRVGENISTELLEAIQDSRISLIVLSRDYAASSWCLEELAKIMECRKTLNQLVFPIFYKVDPSDVRKQKHSFEEAFAEHEKRFTAEKEKEKERVLRWRNALTEASNLKGFHYTVDRHEGEFIKEIVDEILNHVNTYLYEATHPVGLHSRVWEVNSLLSVGSNDVRIIGICSMGGMGKTTIAKSVYNNFFHRFEHKSFLANVSEISKQSNGQVHLQEQLLSDILKKKNIEVNNVDQGINMIKERLRNKRVLMVLDDVDELEQLTMLAILKRDWFGLGSRIIITTRDVHLLKVIEVDGTYMLQKLNYNESLELFSWHAFKRRHPKENYVKLSKDIVHYCDGLPLALEVVGSLLFKSDASDWECTLKQLREIPPKKIQKKLRISYDGLEHDKQKDIFLHIACFFIGVDKDYALEVLNACGFYAKSGINALIRKCLLKINENKLMMHDLVRDMGREIVREECPKELGNRSRLWSHNDVLDVLRKCKGTKAVEGLILNLSIQNEERLCTEAFVNMYNLRLLQLNYVDINGRYHHFSKELRWVCWHGFPLKFIPENFHLESVVVLDMRYSKLRQFSTESEALKILDLSQSYYLTKTPNFSKMPNIEKLKLNDCTSLVEIHPSICNLHRLVLLDISYCKQLKSLPNSICMLKSLETFNLSGCSKLIKLIADGTAINQVPTSIVDLKNIEKLSLRGCRGLTSKSFSSAWPSWVSRRESPNSISFLLPSLQVLTSLTRLELANCNLSDDIFPKDIQSLLSLKYLDLGGNNFSSLPASISKLSRLEQLELCCCRSLRSLTELPTSLWSLVVEDCISLERVRHMSTSRIWLLSKNCPKLVVAPGLEELINDAIILPLWCNNILAASTLKEHIVQNHEEIYILGQFVPGLLASFWSSSLSLVLLRCFEDARLVTYISYKFGAHANLVISYVDKLEVEIRSTDANLGVKKKWKVHPYDDKPEGGSSQPNGVDEILQETDSHGNTMITGSGRWNGNIFWRLFQYFCHPGYYQFQIAFTNLTKKKEIDITKIIIEDP